MRSIRAYLLSSSTFPSALILTVPGADRKELGKLSSEAAAWFAAREREYKEKGREIEAQFSLDVCVRAPLFVCPHAGTDGVLTTAMAQ